MNSMGIIHNNRWLIDWRTVSIYCFDKNTINQYKQLCTLCDIIDEMRNIIKTYELGADVSVAKLLYRTAVNKLYAIETKFSPECQGWQGRPLSALVSLRGQ